MSDTASFVDPVFLARFGLSRFNVLDYFLHPLNPFRTKVNTSNEVLGMQGINVGTLMQQGTGMSGGPMSPAAAEEEYARALSRLNGEQYELMPASSEEELNTGQSPLFVVRHVKRTGPTAVKVLGVYYVLEGVVYKAPSVRGLMKANVTRTLGGLDGACDALSVCARYEPGTGYTWNFDAAAAADGADDDGKKKTKTKKEGGEKRKAGGGDGDGDGDGVEDDASEDDEEDAVATVLALRKRRRRQRRILDNRRLGERTAEEEEGIRASEAVDRILVRLSKCPVVVEGKTRAVAGGGAIGK
uniref:Mediator of RNA polymerase II transcription subunit 6 n=1 Tax=Odontella aurita TaxID=265563 RepID=A0A7S4N3K2_9STRA|mmetsp:Transcript_46573/g.141087  ORF Transcript_46573/g.141087 Transcript_46573/m.141087 type:complete len:300 (+) Transcript_46573:224-1123(+)